MQDRFQRTRRSQVGTQAGTTGEADRFWSRGSGSLYVHLSDRLLPGLIPESAVPGQPSRIFVATRVLVLGLLSIFCALGLVTDAQSVPSLEADKWILVGTFVSSGQAAAVLQDASGTERILFPGHEIAGCSIEGIDARGVELLCTEGRQRLWLHSSAGIATGTPLTGVELHNRNIVVSRTWLHELVKDKQRLASEISFLPAVVDGWMYGYQVADLNINGVLRGMGLISGDVITAVNGTLASHPELFVQALYSLRESRLITLQVRREGRTLSLNYLLE